MRRVLTPISWATFPVFREGPYLFSRQGPEDKEKGPQGKEKADDKKNEPLKSERDRAQGDSYVVVGGVDIPPIRSKPDIPASLQDGVNTQGGNKTRRMRSFFKRPKYNPFIANPYQPGQEDNRKQAEQIVLRSQPLNDIEGNKRPKGEDGTQGKIRNRENAIDQGHGQGQKAVGAAGNQTIDGILQKFSHWKRLPLYHLPAGSLNFEKKIFLGQRVSEIPPTPR
jgi:hypothetical protein